MGGESRHLLLVTDTRSLTEYLYILYSFICVSCSSVFFLYVLIFMRLVPRRFEEPPKFADGEPCSSASVSVARLDRSGVVMWQLVDGGWSEE